MPDVENVNARQRAVVDQSSEVRDPADDSGMMDDPAAVADTYPEAFDDSVAEAEAAIDRESATDHSPQARSTSTDTARDRQI